MTDESDAKYREWAIALGVTTAVFLVTTLLLASILFVVVCRKIAKLRKERKARVTGVMQGEYGSGSTKAGWLLVGTVVE